MHESALTTPIEVLRDHWELNAASPLVLYQQSYPLLRGSVRSASDAPPKFIVVSSRSSSITLAGTSPIAIAAYSGSKAAVNFLTAVIHRESEEWGLGGVLLSLPLRYSTED
jgi:NAD(P)-dependent dehydrogenase (short-subunit alcohol dehydrogenase family)